MRTTMFMNSTPLGVPTYQALREDLLSPTSRPTAVSGEVVKHILIGSPGAVRQTIHLLHTLNYAETVLWTPILRIQEPVVITPERGEAMSLLRKTV